MKHFYCTILLCSLFICTYAQNTVGLISYNETKTFEGYNLIYPHNQANVYLINNCGEIVHTWEDEANFRPANTAYLTEDGLLYKTKRSSSVTDDAIWAGGGGAIIEIRDWDNNLLYEFEMNDSLYRLHHDIALTKEGNIIALAWELKNIDECIAAGKDTSTLMRDEIWPDWVFELDPKTDSIIWEWHAWDHLVQDFDETKANYGVVADSPWKIDINYYREDGHPDWHHSNAIDYNDTLSQILLSVPYFDEIWIIDHTTKTSEEAASNVGGFGGRGGDLLFRWGNPEAYDQGDSTDQKLFFQHDAHWVNDFLDPFHPQWGAIAVFNNRIGENFSTANIIRPAWEMYKWLYKEEDDRFLPDDVDLTYTHPEITRMYSTGLSSIQSLPNGNTLLTSGRAGYTFELTPNNEIVWEYITPRKGLIPATQGDSLELNQNLTFRVKRYPIDFKAFDDKDLSPKGWIELEPDSTFCDRLTSIENVMIDENFKIFPNPANNFIAIEWDGMKYVDIEIFDVMGRSKFAFRSSGGRKYCDISTWENGIYFASILIDNQRYTRKFFVQK